MENNISVKDFAPTAISSGQRKLVIHSLMSHPAKTRKPETNKIPKLSRMEHSGFQRGKIWKDSTEQTQKGFM